MNGQELISIQTVTISVTITSQITIIMAYISRILAVILFLVTTFQIMACAAYTLAAPATILLLVTLLAHTTHAI